MEMVENKTVGRDLRFDLFRIIGLLCAILAHVYPPEFLLQLRNFDVPLMVLVSGSVYALSTKKIKYGDYFIKRIIRLVAPTWAFLTIYFGINLVISNVKSVTFPFSARKIFSSYFLIQGIGYVWVIRVFILSALVLPLFSFLYKRIKNKSLYLLVLLAIYISYEILYYILSRVPINVSVFNYFLQYVVYYAMPFGCVAGFGLLLPTLRKKDIYSTALVSFLLFAGLSISFYLKYKYFVPTQNYKYPARIYYLSYSIFVSFLLFSLIGKFRFKNSNNKFFLFLSSSTIWIYLWHILYLDVWKNNFVQVLPQFLRGYLYQYLFVLSLATLTTYIQKKVVSGFIHILHPGNAGKWILTEIFLK